MPDLMAMSACVVFPRVVPLGALLHVDIQPKEVAKAKEQVVGDRAGKLKFIPVVIINQFIDKQVGERDGEGASKSSVEDALILLILAPVDPLEEADYKAEGCEGDDAGEIDDGYFQLAVHAVVEGREGAARNQDVYACVVKTIGDCVDF